jgi:S-adenosylmethionine decarboxylase
MNPGKDFGRHYVADLFGCDPEKLKTVEPVRDLFLRAARECRATILDHVWHQFEPFGVSGVVLIAESHFAIHTWPEDGYAGVDVFTCGKEMDADLALEIVRRELGARHATTKVLVRGRLDEA